MAGNVLIVWADDTLYPERMYRESACRAGARSLHTLTRLDIQSALLRYYTAQGQEERALTCALNACHCASLPNNLIHRTLQTMLHHRPRIAPYEDAREVFVILQALGCILVLITEGVPVIQHNIVETLGLSRVFRHILHANPDDDVEDWRTALLMADVLTGTDARGSVTVCGNPERAAALAASGYETYCVIRDATAKRPPPIPGVTHMRNLYALPEAIGFIDATVT